MQALDPFAYWPSYRSRVKGLGGQEKGPDRAYVFHSNYADLAPGPTIAEVAFEDLKARNGMIAVCVFQNDPTGSPQITERGKTTALLPSVAKAGRPIRVAFEAVEGATYAIMGHVYGDCDARAQALSLTVDKSVGGEEDASRRRSLFGRWKARRVTGLASVEGPRLSWPVSQGFTEAQLREPEFAHWAARLPVQATPIEQWQSAYILQVLETYGRLEPEVRMLGLAMASDPVATIAREAGGDVTPVMLAAGEAIETAMQRAFPDPAAGRGFDVVWSRAEVFGSGGSARAAGLIEESMERMRPGGLGIHILVRDGDEMDENALNRVAIGLAAEGHIVAQLRHDRSERRSDGPAPFGLIVRKSTDSLLV